MSERLDLLSGSENTMVRLKAGLLEMLLYQSALRKISYGNKEIVRAVYAAVRDQNWGTLPFIPKAADLEESKDSFILKIKGVFGTDKPVGSAEIEISGNAPADLEFRFTFSATRSFLKNRIGICVLLPVEESIGMPYRHWQSGGDEVSGVFPVFIDPQQPLMDIKTLEWVTPGSLKARLDFEGDIFEMEDQRNWTDASFKIYSTPLAIPFPAEVKVGDVVSQKIHLSLPVTQKSERTGKSHEIRLTGKSIPLPLMGICLAENKSLPMKDLKEVFSQLPFHYIRVDIRLSDSHPIEALKDAFSLAKELGSLLELALHTHKDCILPDGFISILDTQKSGLSRILVFSDSNYVSNGADETRIISTLRSKLENVKVGGGSDANFAELNRNPLSPENTDFISVAANPQVHATDDMSLIENIEGLSYMMQSIKNQYPELPVVISPLSFRPGFNPVSTEENGKNDLLSKTPDLRLYGIFGALWTLAAIKRIALFGAETLTLFELMGINGIIQKENNEIFGNSLDTPLFRTFKFLAGLKGKYRILDSVSTFPEEVDSLILSDSLETIVMVLNFSSREKSLKLPVFAGNSRLILISEENSENSVTINGHELLISGRQLLILKYKL